MKQSFMKTLRVSMGLTNEQMAKAMKFSTAHLSRVENGTREMDEGDLRRLSEMTGLTVAEIIEFRRRENDAREMLNPQTQSRLMACAKRVKGKIGIKPTAKAATTPPDWKTALAACNGDYVAARRRYPEQYNNFMQQNTNNRSK